MSSTVTIQQNLGLEKSRYSDQSDKSPLISDLIKAISDESIDNFQHRGFKRR